MRTCPIRLRYCLDDGQARRPAEGACCSITCPRRGSGRMIYGNAGKAAVASYPTQWPKRRASRPGLKLIGRQARCIRYHRAESYLIWDVLGHPDLTLKGKITFGVSAAQENKIDIDRTRPA